MEKISIITINYNGFKDTAELLETIPVCSEIEVIVVDNCSREDEATMIANRYPHVNVVRSKENLGFAGGNNLGIKAATGKYLFFINNDTLLKGTDEEKLKGLQALTNRLDSDPDIGLVCPKLRFSWENCPIQFAGYTPLSHITLRNHAIGCGEADNGQYDTPHPTPYAHGAAMMTTRKAIEKTGLMPECFFLYYEELDWSMMFRRAGYTIWYDPAFTVYHKESQSTGQQSPLRTYYITRNRLLFAKRNLPLSTRIFTYVYLIGAVAQRDILKNIFSKRTDLSKATLRGIRDFIRKRQGVLTT